MAEPARHRRNKRGNKQEYGRDEPQGGRDLISVVQWFAAFIGLSLTLSSVLLIGSERIGAEGAAIMILSGLSLAPFVWWRRRP